MRPLQTRPELSEFRIGASHGIPGGYFGCTENTNLRVSGKVVRPSPSLIRCPSVTRRDNENKKSCRRSSVDGSSVASQRRFAGGRALLRGPPVNASRLQLKKTPAAETGHSCSEGRDSDILATSGSGRRVRPAATSAAAVLLCAKKGRFQSDICVPYLPPNGNWASCSTPILFTGWLEETSNFFRAQVEKRKLSATAEDTGPRRCRGRLQLHRDANQTTGTR